MYKALILTDGWPTDDEIKNWKETLLSKNLKLVKELKASCNKERLERVKCYVNETQFRDKHKINLLKHEEPHGVERKAIASGAIYLIN